MPIATFILFNLQLDKFVVIQTGDFNIGCEYRCSQSDFISLVKQLVLHQAGKDVVHGSRSAFSGKQVKLTWRIATEHLLFQVFMDDLLAVD